MEDVRDEETALEWTIITKTAHASAGSSPPANTATLALYSDKGDASPQNLAPETAAGTRSKQTRTDGFSGSTKRSRSEEAHQQRPRLGNANRSSSAVASTLRALRVT